MVFRAGSKVKWWPSYEGEPVEVTVLKNDKSRDMTFVRYTHLDHNSEHKLWVYTSDLEE